MNGKKILIVPDSFKGTMSSIDVCSIIAERFTAWFPESSVVSVPVADGGEGSVDSFLLSVGGSKVYETVKGPYMEDIKSFYGLIDDGKTAIIEMAACAGLPLAGTSLHPDKTTTYGVGQLLLHAARRGCTKIIAALGGSATNDMGFGAAAAMGARFLDARGRSFIPVGGTISKIVSIDMSGFPQKLPEIIAMCDVDNPLYGENGAAYVFAPQKGADSVMVKQLDSQLRCGADALKLWLGTDISELPGSGAAGGMGGGMAAFLGAKLRSGIDTVLDTVGFDKMLDGAGLVISGEGKFDLQSLRGKVVDGVAKRAFKKNVPVLAIVGDIGDGIEMAYDKGVTAIFSTNRVAVDYSVAKTRAREDLKQTTDNICRLMQLSRQQFL